MNKAINVFSGIIMAFFCVLVMSITYDLSISSSVSLKDLPFKEEICGGFALLIFLLGALRMKRRWQGVMDMKRFSNFSFVTHVAKSARNLSLLFTIAENVFIGFLIFFMYRTAELSPEYVLPMIIVLAILFIDNVIFSGQIRAGGNGFRVGVNKKVVAYFNREMYLFYYTGLKRIEMHQDMINFQYKGDLNLFLPLEVINKKDRKAFREAVVATMDNREKTEGKVVYMDDAFRVLE